MEPSFGYNPNPSPPPEPPPAPAPVQASDLGLLTGLVGLWGGKGFNAIWRPNPLVSGQDRFLELNVTGETLEFEVIPGGGIPNRGLLQSGILMAGLRYLQQITDANVAPPNNGLHLEPGLWLNVPGTTNPAVAASVARLASIPHGTSILAQGLASQASGGPTIPPVSLNPVSIQSPSASSPFPEQNLATETVFRTTELTGITQSMVDDPNSLLLAALQGQTIVATITLQVSTSDLPVPGGGIANTAFLAGGLSGPNAVTARVSSTFWLETVQGSPNFLQLQYSQTVLLNFNGLSWPHVTVATLRQSSP
ncbi:MAG: heme-binding protein [Actinomycetota bacterium]|nr:heme-binding protein [Actinomycetota bacterium]